MVEIDEDQQYDYRHYDEFSEQEGQQNNDDREKYEPEAIDGIRVQCTTLFTSHRVTYCVYLYHFDV